MKRFYCVVCKRVKRVRLMPDNVRNADAIDVRAREGECRRHASVVKYMRKAVR